MNKVLKRNVMLVHVQIWFFVFYEAWLMTQVPLESPKPLSVHFIRAMPAILSLVYLWAFLKLSHLSIVDYASLGVKEIWRRYPLQASTMLFMFYFPTLTYCIRLLILWSN